MPIRSQSLDVPNHSQLYPAIDPLEGLKDSARGKVVFVAGASRGIGQAVAVNFAKAGARAVFVTARTEAALSDTVAQVRAAGADCAARACDVTDAKAVEAAITACKAQFGAIDVVDANAGVLNPFTKIGETDPDSWWHNWDVNIRGTYHVIRYALPHLTESAAKWAEKGGSGGHLILMSSIGAQLVRPGASDYQTSKHAINRLCEFVQIDHGEDGIKCFALHPGGVATELGLDMPEEMHEYLQDSPDLAGGFSVWLASGQADWAAGRYLSATWDVEALTALRETILGEELLVNRLRGM